MMIFLISNIIFRMELDVKYQQNSIENPWNVEKIEEFLYFCCPECDSRDHSQLQFIQHALENHPNSQEFVTNFNKFIVKEEACEANEINETYYENCSLESYDNYYNSNEILKCEIKEEEHSDTELNELLKNQSNSVNENIYNSSSTKDPLNSEKTDENKTYDCINCNETFASAKERWNHNYRSVPDAKNCPLN